MKCKECNSVEVQFERDALIDLDATAKSNMGCFQYKPGKAYIFCNNCNASYEKK